MILFFSYLIYIVLWDIFLFPENIPFLLADCVAPIFLAIYKD